ncbi:hypothetical protein BpHYR1_004207 [Brachionus plicatilis]|uniref:Uncharacterized protein n=1 Tax=Brachionus plicatilis TaxID=10195 RepID=A0A3M7R1B0_BRAPC|nr:hypothetical protein BpHYR1_004207 [Brachionus plicatilis]
MVLQKVQYCTNWYIKIPSSAKTLQFIAWFNQGFFDGVHFTENCRIYCRVLQNQYIGGTKDESAATIFRTCFGPSELKLWNFLMPKI